MSNKPYVQSNPWQRIEKALSYVDVSDKDLALANRIDLNFIDKKFDIMATGVRGELDRLKKRLHLLEGSRPGGFLVIVGIIQYWLSQLRGANRAIVRITLIG